MSCQFGNVHVDVCLSRMPQNIRNPKLTIKNIFSYRKKQLPYQKLTKLAFVHHLFYQSVCYETVDFIILTLYWIVNTIMVSTTKNKHQSKMLFSQSNESFNDFVIGGVNQASLVENGISETQNHGFIGNFRSVTLDHLIKIAYVKFRSLKEILPTVLEKRLIMLLPPFKVESMTRFRPRWTVVCLCQESKLPYDWVIKTWIELYSPNFWAERLFRRCGRYSDLDNI